MSEPTLEIDIPAWVERARNDPVSYRSRQATEIILNAIAHTAPLNHKLWLKGGVLMGIAYDSPRQTTDIDLTTSLTPGQENADTIVNLLDGAFPGIIAKLGYAGFVLAVHSVRLMPRGIGFEAEFPALKIKVGHAQAGTSAQRALMAGTAAEIVEIDISFNEPLSEVQVLGMPEGAELCAYSLTDLMAEKFRAMLQQVIRRRNRRQDVYDLDRLIGQHAFDDKMRAAIHAAFLLKCESRRITPSIESLDDPEVKQRSGADWETLALELGELPEFEACYARVRQFYRALPW